MQGNAVGKPCRPAIILFRNDLRLGESRALSAAVSSGAPFLNRRSLPTSFSTNPRERPATNWNGPA